MAHAQGSNGTFQEVTGESGGAAVSRFQPKGVNLEGWCAIQLPYIRRQGGISPGSCFSFHDPIPWPK